MQRKVTGLRAIGLATWLLVAFAGLAQAKPIPKETLAADHKACVASCTQQGLSAAQCAPYCDCSTKSMAEQFTLEEYAAVLTSAGQKQEPDQKLIDRFGAISTSCAKRIP